MPVNPSSQNMSVPTPPPPGSLHRGLVVVGANLLFSVMLTVAQAKGWFDSWPNGIVIFGFSVSVVGWIWLFFTWDVIVNRLKIFKSPMTFWMAMLGFGLVVPCVVSEFRPPPKADIIGPDEWPPLSDEQINCWITALAPLKPSEIDVYLISDTADHKLVRSLKKVANGIHCNLFAAPPGVGDGKGFDGISITSSRDECGAELHRLFSNAKYPVIFERKDEAKWQGTTIAIGSKP